MSRTWTRTAALMIIPGAMAGCATPSTPRPHEPQPVSVSVEPTRVRTPMGAPASAAPVVRLLGSSREGRPIECVDIGRGTVTVLLIATIHGDEDAGTPLLEDLATYLVLHPEAWLNRRVVIVPCLNPDGYETGHRENARGVDLNRNYPAANWRQSRVSGGSAASEPETEVLLALIENIEPDRIVSIHQPLACIDYDGPADDLARAMAETSDLEVRRLGTRPGSLGAYAGESLGIPIITLELPRDASGLSREALWDRYAHMMLTSISYPRAATKP